MKTIKTYLIIFLIPLVTITFINCEGKEGPPGADGNANVKSLTVDKNTLNWVSGDYIGVAANLATITSDLINQSIIDNGTVLGYMLYKEKWIPLPYDLFYSTLREHIGFYFELNKITLFAYNNSSGYTPNDYVSKFRFIIIPDNTAMSPQSSPIKQDISTQLKNSGVDINNYGQVCKHFGITP